MSVYLSIVVPLHNEEESVELLLSNILDTGDKFDFPYEIIFVDDGSTDNTWEILKKLKASTPRLKCIKFRRNHGQTAGMSAGFSHARGEIIISMDGDLQNDPKDIPSFLKKIEEGYDIVCGWRKNRQDKLISRKIPSKVANWLIGMITGIKIHDNGCSLKAYKALLIKNTSLYSDMHRFIPAMASLTGARIGEIVVRHHPRQFGEAKYGLSRVWKVFFDIVSVKMLTSFSEKPAIWFGILSIPFWMLGTLFFIISVIMYLYGQDNFSIVFPSSAILLLFASGQLLVMGFLSEYILRVEKPNKKDHALPLSAEIIE
jgi:glycosyltransferase involved in cell wall biosynthesis